MSAEEVLEQVDDLLVTHYYASTDPDTDSNVASQEGWTWCGEVWRWECEPDGVFVRRTYGGAPVASTGSRRAPASPCPRCLAAMEEHGVEPLHGEESLWAQRR